MKIEWTPEAAAELDRMLAYISRSDPSAAALVAHRVLKAEGTILTFPNAGRFDNETSTYDIYVPKTRIVLTYAIREEIIWIITVWHTSRDPDTKPQRSA